MATPFAVRLMLAAIGLWFFARAWINHRDNVATIQPVTGLEYRYRASRIEKPRTYWLIISLKVTSGLFMIFAAIKLDTYQ